MTALADIAKAAAVMYGDTLRGSDLTQFNEAHPRDDAGRFAAVGGGGGGLDPRTQRKARRLRRARKAVGASQIRTAAAAPAQADPRSLQHLAERLLPIKTRTKPNDLRVRTNVRNKEVAQPPKEVGGKPKEKYDVALDDLTYLTNPAGEKVSLRRVESVTFIPMAQAIEFLARGKLTVGAANDRWGTTLTSAPIDNATSPFLEENSVVAIRYRNPHWVVDEKGKQTGQLAANQVIRPIEDRKGPAVGFTDYLPIDPKTGKVTYSSNSAVHIRVIDVNGFDQQEWKAFGPEDEQPFEHTSKSAIWEEEEHPRDLRSGRFAAQAGGGGGGLDPRVMRQRRRRRRGAKALASIAARAEAPVAQELRTRTPVPREIPVRTQDRELAHRTAHQLVQEAPADAEVQFLADPVMRSVEERIEHYERTNVYPEIRVALSAADGLIQEAASGEINANTREAQVARALFSKMFLQGQRHDSQFAGEITDKDVEQALGQLQGSQRLFNLMQKHGAGQWTMTTGDYVKPETAAATTISVHADDLAALTGYAPARNDTGFGARAMPISQYRAAQAVAADREAAIALSRDIVTMRVEDAEGYARIIVPQMLRFTSGQVSFNEAMQDTALALGNEQAARHYGREEATQIAVSTATSATRAAAKVRSTASRAKTEVRQEGERQRLMETVAQDAIEANAREKAEVAPGRDIKGGRAGLHLATTGYDLLEDAEAPDPRVKERPVASRQQRMTDEERAAMIERFQRGY